MIREILPTDLNEVVDLEKTIFSVSALSELQILDSIYSSIYKSFVKIENNKIVGYIIFYDAYDTYEIIRIGVDINYRNRGLGESLLNIVSNKTLFLEVRENNFPAISFYKKNGFYEVNKRLNYYKDNNETAIVMKKDY